MDKNTLRRGQGQILSRGGGYYLPRHLCKAQASIALDL
jgi:hypothetical protein